MTTSNDFNKEDNRQCFELATPTTNEKVFCAFYTSRGSNMLCSKPIKSEQNTNGFLLDEIHSMRTMVINQLHHTITAAGSIRLMKYFFIDKKYFDVSSHDK